MNIPLWRDIAVVILALQLFIMLVIPLAIAFFMVKGINWVHAKLPPVWDKAHHYSGLVRDKTEEYSNVATEPVLRLRSRVESWSTVWASVWSSARPSASPFTRGAESSPVNPAKPEERQQ